MKLQEIKIEGLFGDLDYNIKLVDNKLILVAENGSGKTTIVNMIYYFLSRQWVKLLKYDFLRISAIINGKTISVERNKLKLSNSSRLKKFTNRYGPSVVSKAYSLMESIDSKDVFSNPSSYEEVARRIGIPLSALYHIAEEYSNEQTSLFEDLIPNHNEVLSGLVDCQILYLPTYRRIEQDLKVIFPDLESDVDNYKRRRKEITSKEDNAYIELVEFGMQDVEKNIERKLAEVKENLNRRIKNNLTGGYLKGIINRNYLNLSYDKLNSINKEALDYMLDRIDEQVLSKNEKERLGEYVDTIRKSGGIISDEDKIIAYFLYSLITIYEDLKKEEKDIEKFIAICNNYCGTSNKRFVYDNINFQVRVMPMKKSFIKSLPSSKIELRDLSSGEKQVVSLFSHLFLSQKKNFFVVIDEPELSLSVAWQQKLLVDISENVYCKGILAVTHSPFIFENELVQYAHGLEEYSY